MGEPKAANAGATAQEREGAVLLMRVTATTDWKELSFASRTDAERSADAAAMMAADISAYN